MSSSRLTWQRAFAALGLLSVVASAVAAEGGGVMYRCPGNDYNNTISAKEAKDRGCHTIESAPVSIVQGTRPRQAAPSGPALTSSAVPSLRVEPAVQKARDSDARRILSAELQTEQERLAALQKDFNNGEPERQGNERNFQKYVDRVSEMKAAIARKESDIAAIRRELAKLPP